MIIIELRDSNFSKRLGRLTEFGGQASGAGRKAKQIIGDLSTGGDTKQFQTNHGESRIDYCVKYDLPSGYRLVTIQPTLEVVITCFIGTHDEAEHWLNTNAGMTLVWDPESKRVDITYANRSVPNYLPPVLNLAPKKTAITAFFDEGFWWKLLQPKALRNQLATLTTESTDDDILGFCSLVGEDVNQERATALFDIILALREGKEEAAKICAEIALGIYQPATPENPVTEAAIRDPINSEHIVILSDLTETEQSQLWDRKRFQDWMVWLHPDQRRLAEDILPGPSALDGVSGSGKTCVLVHRARTLVRRYPKERVLILTLNRSLARLIDRLAKRLCTESEHKRIEALSFHEYISSLLKYVGLEKIVQGLRDSLGLNGEIEEHVARGGVQNVTEYFNHLDETVVAETWNHFVTSEDSGSQRAQERFKKFLVDIAKQPEIDGDRYLAEEFGIVQSVSVLKDDFSAYHAHKREGRSVRLDANQRENVVGILRTWLRFQLRDGKFDEAFLTQAGFLGLDGTKTLPDPLQFRCVLVDEYQDFSSLELDLIRRIPTATQDGLFLAGDQAQRIHAKHFHFESAGLSTIERRYIRKNYRNSREILEAGHALLDAFCGSATAREAGVKVLKPEYAARHSARPLLCGSVDPLAAAWASVAEWIEAGNPACTACILTADTSAFPLATVLGAAPSQIPVARLRGDNLFNEDAAVVATITEVKGFEFGLIVIIGLENGQFPRVISDEVWRDALRLYVAITRARDELRFIYKEHPSPFLEEMADKCQRYEIVLPTVAEATKPLPIPSPDDPVAAPVELTPAPLDVDEPSHEAPAPLAPLVEPPEPTPSPAFHKAEPPATPIIEIIVETAETTTTEPADTPPSEPVLIVPAEEDRTYNGFTFIKVPARCTQLDLVRALGIDHTRLQLACYELGLHLTPTTTIRPIFVRKLMAPYDCVPVFRNEPSLSIQAS